MSEQELPGEQSETETASEEKVTFSEEQQKLVENQLAAKAFETREERRKSVELQRQLDEVKAQIPKETRPDVGNAGDVYDEDFETKQTQREAQIREQATFDARQTFRTEQAQDEQQAEAQRQQASINDSLQKFSASAADFDIDAGAFSQIDRTIGSYGGLRTDVGNRVLNDDKGMLIYQHFAQHPDDIQKVNQMDVGSAAIFVNDIRTKAVALHTKNPSNAPDPTETLKGSGAAPTKRGPGGATYE